MARGADISPLSLLLGRVDAIADGAAPVDTIPSGFPSLDKMLGGGIPAGYSVMLAGPSGSGKTVLSSQFIIEGSKQGDSSVIAVFSADKTGQTTISATGTAKCAPGAACPQFAMLVKFTVTVK